MGSVLTLGGVRTEMNCWTHSWCYRMGVVVGVAMMYIMSEKAT